MHGCTVVGAPHGQQGVPVVWSSGSALTSVAVTVGAVPSPAFHLCREIDKTGRDYLAKFLVLHDARDRLHPVINALGAQTGRMSISDPPLQQIPRAGDVRSCLRADRATHW